MVSRSPGTAARVGDQLQDRLITFAVAVCEATEGLPVRPGVARLGDQVMRAATSVAANYAEARAAESRRDTRIFVTSVKTARTRC